MFCNSYSRSLWFDVGNWLFFCSIAFLLKPAPSVRGFPIAPCLLRASNSNAGRPSSSSMRHFFASSGTDMPKKFQCRQCHYSTNIMTNLRHHVRVHSGERPFKCSDCGKGFIQKIQMIKHNCAARMRDVVLPTSAVSPSGLAPSSPVPPANSLFSCSKCGEAFLREALLLQHVMLMHMSQWAEFCWAWK